MPAAQADQVHGPGLAGTELLLYDLAGNPTGPRYRNPPRKLRQARAEHSDLRPSQATPPHPARRAERRISRVGDRPAITVCDETPVPGAPAQLGAHRDRVRTSQVNRGHLLEGYGGLGRLHRRFVLARLLVYRRRRLALIDTRDVARMRRKALTLRRLGDRQYERYAYVLIAEEEAIRASRRVSGGGVAGDADPPRERAPPARRRSRAPLRPERGRGHAAHRTLRTTGAPRVPERPADAARPVGPAVRRLAPRGGSRIRPARARRALAAALPGTVPARLRILSRQHRRREPVRHRRLNRCRAQSVPAVRTATHADPGGCRQRAPGERAAGQAARGRARRPPVCPAACGGGQPPSAP